MFRGFATTSFSVDDLATASVVDPFGNVLGVMHDPHYLEVLAARGRTAP